MGKLKNPWLGGIKSVIYEYPALRAELLELRKTATTAAYGPVSHGNCVSDPVCAAAVRELPPRQQRRYDAVRRAIKETERYPNGQDRLKIIEMVYWKRTHTLTGAALQVPCSERTAKRYNGAFVRAVERFLDLP